MAAALAGLAQRTPVRLANWQFTRALFERDVARAPAYREGYFLLAADHHEAVLALEGQLACESARVVQVPEMRICLAQARLGQLGHSLRTLLEAERLARGDPASLKEIQTMRKQLQWLPATGR